MGLVYKVGGAVTSITVTGGQNDATELPTLASGDSLRYIVVQILAGVTSVVKTGAVGDVCAGGLDGMLLQRNSGDLVLNVMGHTHIHLWSSAGGSVVVTPLGERPG